MTFKFSSRVSIILSATLCIVGFLWTSCSKDVKDLAIVLDKDSIEVLAGAKDTIHILSGNNDCVVTTDNENIAFAEIKENNIIISTSEMGVASLTITDKLKRTAEIKVYSTGPTAGGWKEYFQTGVEFVFVDADDDIVKEQIKSQLIEEAQKRIGAVYIFDITEFHYRAGNYSEGEDGSYTVKDLILTLKYADREEIYEISGGKTHIQLKQNVTAYFSEQYPNAGITKVEEYRRLAYFTY